MTFKERFPSLPKDLYDRESHPLMHTDSYVCAWVDDCLLDKQRAREIIIKYTQGTKHIRHEDCDRPYGDECGYCEFCRQRQSELQSKIFKELGL